MADDRLGAYLRSCREARGVSIETLARETRIAPRVLEALERGWFESLPAPVFVRGFIRAYLRHLGSSPKDALALYEAWLAAHGAPDEPAPPPRTLSRHVPLAATALLLLLLAGGLYLVAPRAPQTAAPPGHAGRVSAPREPTVAIRPEAPVQRPARGASAVALTPVESAPEAPGEHWLVVEAREATWLRVETGQGTAAQELLLPGEVREWRSRSRFVLTVGNAGGVILKLNGRTLPALGESGEVIRGLVLPNEAES